MMNNKTMNQDTTPNSYDVTFPPEVTTTVYCQIGVQVPSHINSTKIIEQMESILKKSNIQPSHTDIASHNEDDSTKNIIFICYFLHERDYDEWRYSDPIKRLLNDEEHFTDGAGLWFESFRIDVNEFEGQYDRNTGQDGVSHFIDLDITDKYNYFGSMRDRMKASEWDSFPPSHEQMSMIKQGDKINVDIPKNSCFVRTVQDLSEVSLHEKELYDKSIRPYLNKGIEDLANNEKHGCLAVKCADEINNEAEKKEIDSVLAFFQSLNDLEEWAISDKTHLQMYGRYYKHLRELNDQSALSLWHEVFMLDPKQSEIFYIRCKETTGLLRTLHQKK